MIKLIKDEFVLVSGSSICACRATFYTVKEWYLFGSLVEVNAAAECLRHCCEYEANATKWFYYENAKTFRDMIRVEAQSGDCLGV